MEWSSKHVSLARNTYGKSKATQMSAIGYIFPDFYLCLLAKADILNCELTIRNQLEIVRNTVISATHLFIAFLNFFY
jgi:hypothetical protein